MGLTLAPPSYSLWKQIQVTTGGLTQLHIQLCVGYGVVSISATGLSTVVDCSAL